MGKGLLEKLHCPVSLLSVISQIFEKFANNRIVDYLDKWGLFSDFQYGFRSSQSTAHLLTIVSDRIVKAFNRSGASQAAAIDISNAFNRVWHAALLHKLKSYRKFQVRYLPLFLLLSVIDSFGWFCMGKFSQEYPVNVGVPQDSILGLTPFLLCINDLSEDVICNIAIYANGTTVYSKCDQASDPWQQLELALELEFDLQDTVD